MPAKKKTPAPTVAKSSKVTESEAAAAALSPADVLLRSGVIATFSQESHKIHANVSIVLLFVFQVFIFVYAVDIL